MNLGWLFINISCGFRGTCISETGDAILAQGQKASAVLHVPFLAVPSSSGASTPWTP